MVEVIVAIALLGIFSAAAAPLLISALRASVVAKLDTTAKNLSQERFELMRNLPFRIAYDATSPTSKDLLDSYYPNRAAPSGGFTTPGYVTTQARRTGEPTAGPFYRTVVTQTLADTLYTQYIAVQFLVPTTRAPIAPPTGYNTSSINDSPPSNLVGITVVTEWRAGNLSKRYTVFSELGDVPPIVPLVTLQARATALKVTTTLGAGPTVDLDLEAGVVNLDGGIANGVTSAASATGGFASLTPGGRVDGAQRTAQAPPDVAAGTTNDLAVHDLDFGGETVARVPRSDATGVTAKTIGGEPVLGTSASPIGAGVYGSADLFFNSRANLPDSALGLDENDPIAWIPANGGTLQARATAYAGSVGGGSHSGTVGLAASTEVVNILPTDFAPAGLIQARLTASTLTCSSTGTVLASTPTYSAQVRLWKYTPFFAGLPLAGGTSGYTAWTALSSAQVADPLATVSLTPGPGGYLVGVNSGRAVYLGEYLSSMTSQTASSLAAAKATTATGRGLETKLPAMVSFSTVPLRDGEDLSNVNVSLGVFGCIAEDNR